ncbi:MAG: sugar transferase [Sedimentisphaerales bacterium]|nr:sugar transferase [Sedimentisphaerales bacterium]
MNLIIIHKDSITKSSESNMLQFAMSDKLITDIVLDGLGKYLYDNNGKKTIPNLIDRLRSADTIYAVPKQSGITAGAIVRQEKDSRPSFETIIHYEESIKMTADVIEGTGQGNSPPLWSVITNGQFAARLNNELLASILADIRADIVAVNAEPALLDKNDKIRLTTENNVAGFRRLYSDSAELVPCPDNWPHYLFIKTGVLKKLVSDGFLPESFPAFIEKCRKYSITPAATNIGGTVLDLCTENGLLEFCRERLETDEKVEFGTRYSNMIPENSRCIGNVLFDNHAQIGENVIIAGPTIIGENAIIEQGAIINSSIIGPGVRVPQNRFVNNTIIQKTRDETKKQDVYFVQKNFSPVDTSPSKDTETTYRCWSRLSYARCLKRIADFIFAVIVLILFIPLIPLIALAIKINSPGPVFFKDKRQGLHGREFNCLKFRTMVTGADKIQEKLKYASQVDGPQFKMANDPRISAVGVFLRETYIDEIPQFFNVLLGQMSVVGPRPSPESENILCPSWRDARLSVRPGITGLWQIRRTRVPTKDFQEWIRYDTEYVRELSFRTDIRICWDTVKKLVNDFINQF